MKGLDAAELMALAPPEAGYAVLYSAAEDVATAAIRRELEGLRLTALQRRAAAEGVGEEQLAAAVDSDDPKAELIALLLDSHAAAAGAADVRVAALRRELEGLKMTALQRRASAEGHSEEALEGAVDCENPRAALIELLAAGPPLVAAAAGMAS